MAEPDYDAEMMLPPGKTCGDCIFCRHCCAIYGHVPADTKCDFWPSRYKEHPVIDRAIEIAEGGK